MLLSVVDRFFLHRVCIEADIGITLKANMALFGIFEIKGRFEVFVSFHVELGEIIAKLHEFRNFSCVAFAELFNEKIRLVEMR